MRKDLINDCNTLLSTLKNSTSKIFFKAFSTTGDPEIFNSYNLRLYTHASSVFTSFTIYLRILPLNTFKFPPIHSDLFRVTNEAWYNYFYELFGISTNNTCKSISIMDHFYF